jgi:hypothetical protein
MHIFLHSSTIILGGFILKLVILFIHILKLKPLINFFQGLEYFFSTTEDIHPNFPSELLIIIIETMEVIKDPRGNLFFCDKTLNYSDSIIEVEV